MNTYFYLHPELKQHFSNEKPLVSQIMALRGECFRQQKGRLTMRVMLGDKSYFIKQYTGVSGKELLKNIFQFRLPITNAKPEWQAINRLLALGIAVPAIVGVGWGLEKQQSFLLMEDLTPTMSLEHLCQTWPHQKPTFLFKKALIEKVAEIARTLHSHGINHRDFYICHFLLDQSPARFTISNSVRLFLIDLHRAQLRKWLPQRWLIKDLAALYFSSKEIGLTRRDRYRFMQAYHGKSLRLIFKKEKKLWKKIQQRGEKLYRDHQ